MESKEMIELRRIRDENSARRLKMSSAEIEKENARVHSWFEEKTGKKLVAVNAKKARKVV